MASVPPIDSSSAHIQALQQASVRNTPIRPRGADEATETNHSPAEDAAEQASAPGKPLNIKTVIQTFNALA